ncbi:type II toxin-antitoxin system RelE/ParE family toxin [Helicobacter salomonis]|uniref:hypothetical protein n=1 Tax=Helicobacter salomonis TaxID=56878 RepID=UPI0013158649|nr:hypothetical protein [Helicobacter salomonis]
MEIQTSNEFEKWLDGLKDDYGHAIITRRISNRAVNPLALAMGSMSTLLSATRF